MTCTEAVVATAPFTVRRRIKWGECDPAGVVYALRRAARDAIAMPAALRAALEQYQHACETNRLANPSHRG